MAYGESGYKYLKTGDESGDLCIECDTPMIIIKTGKRDDSWKLRCQGCGREIPFRSNHIAFTSAYV